MMSLTEVTEQDVLADPVRSGSSSPSSGPGGWPVVTSNRVRREGLGPLSDDEEKRPAQGLVWVIDDDIAVQALLKSVFGRDGYSVSVSGTVAEAMDAMAEGSRSAVIVLDFNIPGGSGLDVLRELRTRSSAPVVMVSNVKRPELVAEAFELGADEFVEKPFDPRSLLIRVRRLMG